MDAAMPSVSPCMFGHNVDVPACSKGIEDLRRMLSGLRNQPDAGWTVTASHWSITG